jgi:hypothetical protein
MLLIIKLAMLIIVCGAHRTCPTFQPWLYDYNVYVKANQAFKATKV